MPYIIDVELLQCYPPLPICTSQMVRGEREFAIVFKIIKGSSVTVRKFLTSISKLLRIMKQFTAAAFNAIRPFFLWDTVLVT